MNTVLAFLRPYLMQIAVWAVVILLAVLAVWYIRHLGVVSERQANQLAATQLQLEQTATRLDAYKASAEKASTVAKALEGKLAAAAETQTKLNERLKRELSKNAAYRDCRVPVDGVQLLKDARAGNCPATR